MGSVNFLPRCAMRCGLHLYRALLRAWSCGSGGCVRACLRACVQKVFTARHTHTHAHTCIQREKERKKAEREAVTFADEYRLRLPCWSTARMAFGGVLCRRQHEGFHPSVFVWGCVCPLPQSPPSTMYMYAQFRDHPRPLYTYAHV